ncbi:PWWP2A [Cordylochernes scorpioides]|uniref:PWWP2A n=1 Tax=Cordylochernes scorpioides TaxID=51811 RepID=A0ABY6LDF2_9ARAC|nr:PWWP2A [Cordylochernes scorpioides]
MRFSSTEVKRCVLENGRDVTIGDVVWGKVQGFPWWPGKVLALTECQRDNSSLSQQAHVSWFGSTTSSYMPCSRLVSFLDEFKVRYNRKKRGSYREAIRQATLEVEAQKGAPVQLPAELGCLLAAT